MIAVTVEQGGFGAETAAPIARLMASQWFGKPLEVRRRDLEDAVRARSARSQPPERAQHGRAAAARSPRLPLDPLLTLAVIGLGVCSVMTLRAGHPQPDPRRPHYYVDRQAVYLVIGLVLMLALSRLDYARLRRFKNGDLRGADPEHPGGARASATPRNGAQRAINFPFFSFQASELGKVLLIVSLRRSGRPLAARCATATRPPA